MAFLLPSRSAKRIRRSEQGYIMLTLMLMVALIMIAFTAIVVPMQFEMKRDQETEMIHRGTQYTRAIRSYYKKFGRYPSRLEDLENTNNLRYLRRRYKDPVTGKDFRLLHFGDPDVKLTGSIGGAGIAGANTVQQLNQQGNGSAFGGSGGSGFGGNSSFGNSGQGQGGGFGQSSGFGGGGSSPGGNSGFGGGSGFGGSSNSFGSNSNQAANSNSSGTTSTGGTDAAANGAAPSTDANGQPGTANSGDSNGQNGGNGSNGSSTSGSTGIFGSSGQNGGGGGAILGVACTAKKDTVREYNKKHKYNEWQFVYDPTADRGGLITTPYQPQLAGFGQTNLNGTQNGANGSNGTNGSNSPFGQSGGSGFGSGQSGQSGFGQSSFGSSSGQSGFGNGNSGGSTNQTQPNP